MNYKIFLISRRGQGAGIRGQGLAPDSLTRQLPTTPKGDNPEK